jgi:hypothetical protein
VGCIAPSVHLLSAGRPCRRAATKCGSPRDLQHRGAREGRTRRRGGCHSSGDSALHTGDRTCGPGAGTRARRLSRVRVGASERNRGRVEHGTSRFTIRYARETQTPTGRRIDVVTDKPVYFFGGGAPEPKPREASRSRRSGWRSTASVSAVASWQLQHGSRLHQREACKSWTTRMTQSGSYRSSGYAERASRWAARGDPAPGIGVADCALGSGVAFPRGGFSCRLQFSFCSRSV